MVGKDVSRVSSHTRRVRVSLICVAIATLALVTFAAQDVPIQIMQPGTQPEDQVNAFATNCASCHFDAAPDPNEEFLPENEWYGGMMSNAMRDALFWATVAVAEQDFLPGGDPATRGGVGDLCLRCHGPNGWLGNRSKPTDGSAFVGADERGVECEFCHLMVNPDQPVNIPGTTEEQNAPFEAFDAGTGEGYHGSGQYVINSGGTRLGPYDDASANHQWLASEYHRSGDFCGTCHDVSNPAVGDLAPNNGAQQPLPPGTFSGNIAETDVNNMAAFNNPPYAYGIVERTFSEWKASALDDWRVDNYDALPPELRVLGGSLQIAEQRATTSTATGNYVDGAVRYFTCQTCHMAPIPNQKGCNKNNAPERMDLPRHDQTGGGYWMPQVVMYQDTQGTLLFGSLTPEQRDMMVDGMARAEAHLRSAGSLSAVQNGSVLDVRVTNLTGHKLISGYPEGRRLWLNVKWYDGVNTLIHEDGEYGVIRTLNFNSTDYDINSIIDLDNTVIYQAKPGLSQDWAAALVGLGYPTTLPLHFDRLTDLPEETLGHLATEAPGTEEHSFHFVLNNVLTADNRIPPFGLSYDDCLERSCLPVPDTQYGNPGAGGVFDHFSDVSFAIPSGATRAEVRLYYQQTSWEYIQFLWLSNDGLGFMGQEGENLLDAWLNAGTELIPQRPTQSAPFEMAMANASISGVFGVPGEASYGDVPENQMTASYDNGTGDVVVEYTPACDATDHTIYYGDLSGVSTYAYTGAACFIGSSGTTAFDPGTGSYFFLIVGNDGSEEGSYGLDSLSAERPEDIGTPTCDHPQNLGGVLCE
jgi:mono/diheme cytochrome c family protein